MARKQLISKHQHVTDAIEMYKAEAEARAEIARDIYDFQDDETKEVIDRMCDRLRLGASGYVRVRLGDGSSMAVHVDQEALSMNILFVSTEIFRDLALFGVRLANYEHPPHLCSNCGSIITKKKVKRGA